MAKENFIEAEAEAENGPLFNPYKWAREEIDSAKIPGAAFSAFVTRAHHVGTGIASILEILEMSQIEESLDNGRPIIDACHAGRLMRLAITSADYLSEDAEKMNDWAYEYHTPEGIKERKEPSKY